VLLAAFAEVRRSVPTARLWLAGRGPLEDDIRAEVTRLGLDDHVTLLGFVPNDELLGMLRNREVDVVALPSDGEGVPVSLMEALAAGVPTVACAAGGVAELLGDGCGELVDVGDHDGFVRALRRLLTDDAARRSVAALGRRRVEAEFDSDRTTAELAALLHHAKPRGR
jgi:glycosyltransferase involved in cell wall biosynthesis